MQDLRLVGVHEDGEHLLLSGPGGEMFRLRIDEALHVATSRRRSRLPITSATDDRQPTGERLSPRDIQIRIRGGATAEEVAEISGLTVEHVRKYEGPVLAERAHIAQQARQVHVSDAVPGHDGYRTAFGEDPATLEEMVSHRLTALGVKMETLSWDAWRRPDGLWSVVAEFDAQVSAARNIGEAPPAQWTYSPARKTLQNMNRWAQLLSEIEPPDAPVPARRLNTVADQPFDFEAIREDEDAETSDSGRDTLSAAAGPASDSAQHSGGVTGDPGGQQTEPESVSLLDLLRSRRGQRLGVDEEGDDALALLISDDVSADRSQPNTDGESGPAEPSADSGHAENDAQGSFTPVLSLVPELTGEREQPLPSSEVKESTREITISAAPRGLPGEQLSTDTQASHSGHLDEPEHTRAHAEASENRPSKKTAEDTATPERRKPKRSSVPSWDEIVFGTKTD